MIIWIGVGTLAGIFLLWRFWVYAVSPLHYRNTPPDRLGRFLESLAHYEPGTVLMIDLPRIAGGERFLQFAKYGDARRWGLQFAFPQAPWSEDTYESVRAVVIELDSQWTTVKGEGLVKEFTVVDLEQDLESAEQLAREILRTVFHIGDTDEVLDVYFPQPAKRSEQ